MSSKSTLYYYIFTFLLTIVCVIIDIILWLVCKYHTHNVCNVWDNNWIAILLIQGFILVVLLFGVCLNCGWRPSRSDYVELIV